jgi:hypothetical protein
MRSVPGGLGPPAAAEAGPEPRHSLAWAAAQAADGLTTRDAAALAASVVRRPDTLAAFCLLVLNDHVFKARWPGPITGKLSDLVWPVVAVPVVALLLAPAARLVGRRRWGLVATVLTATPFVAVNLWPAAGELAARVLTSVVGPSAVTTDASDLLALPVLLLPLHHLRRRAVPPRRPAGAVGAVQLALLGLAALGTAATSCGDTRPRVEQVGLDEDGDLIATVGTAYGPTQLVRSEDAGETWQPVGERLESREDLPQPQQEALGGRFGDPDVEPPERCADGACYRLEGESVVGTDGDRTRRIALTSAGRHPAERRYLEAHACPEPLSRAEDLELITSPSGGHRVVVARGLEGISLVEDDRVRHVGVLGAQPVAAHGLRFPMVGPELAVLSVAAAIAWLTLSWSWWAAMARHRPDGRRRRVAAWPRTC